MIEIEMPVPGANASANANFGYTPLQITLGQEHAAAAARLLLEMGEDVGAVLSSEEVHWAG
ncbi:hypothetical protein T484DRAFT_1964313 [Baffinella frigidus]|nr:hypothetical protein T484DRAFT_1964313 [Cryptophyta sp. CCMP2293]